MATDRALARWREAEAVRLRMEGTSYHDIAKALGYRTRSAAWKATNRALERNVSEAVNTYRIGALVDLDILQDAAWKAACSGDHRAIYQCFRAIDQKARMLGLYTTESSSVTTRADSKSGGRRPPRARSTWGKPGAAGRESAAGAGSDPNPYVVLKERCS